MTDAPDKLFLQPCPTLGWEYPDNVPYLGTTATEYTRTDIAQARIAELEAAMRSILEIPNSDAAQGIMKVFAEDALKDKP